MLLTETDSNRVQSERLGPRPLSDARYAECVEIFEAASDQRRLLQDALVDEISVIYAGQSLRVLSVGSGSGEFDAAVLERVLPCLASVDYTGVDPNASQCALARQRLHRLAAPNLDVSIDNTGFDEAYAARTYDVVLCVHSLYYVADPAAAIDTALGALASGGRLMICHAPNEALNTLAEKYWTLEFGHPSWFSGQIRDAFAARGRAYHSRRINAELDATGCPDSGNGYGDDDALQVTATGRAVADFIAQVDIAQLDPATRAETCAELGDIMRSRPDGSRYFPHPVDIVTVGGPAKCS